MIDFLVVTLLVLTGGLAVLGVVTTVLGRLPDRLLATAVGIVEGVIVLQAAIAAIRVLRGVQLEENSTFLIYLAVAVCMLPIGLQFARTEPPSRWGGTVVAVTAIAAGIVVLRLQALWGSPVG